MGWQGSTTSHTPHTPTFWLGRVWSVSTKSPTTIWLGGVGNVGADTHLHFTGGVGNVGAKPHTNISLGGLENVSAKSHTTFWLGRVGNASAYYKVTRQHLLAVPAGSSSWCLASLELWVVSLDAMLPVSSRREASCVGAVEGLNCVLSF